MAPARFERATPACGETTTGAKAFVIGHDQTALHDRVRQVGTVVEFLDWFDKVHGYWPDINVIYEPVAPDGRPRNEAPRMRHRVGCDHFYRGTMAES